MQGRITRRRTNSKSLEDRSPEPLPSSLSPHKSSPGRMTRGRKNDKGHDCLIIWSLRLRIFASFLPPLFHPQAHIPTPPTTSNAPWPRDLRLSSRTVEGVSAGLCCQTDLGLNFSPEMAKIIVSTSWSDCEKRKCMHVEDGAQQRCMNDSSYYLLNDPISCSRVEIIPATINIMHVYFRHSS